MQDSHSLLGLYIPEQRIKQSDALYANLKTVEKWISDLPVAHIGETARLVYKALSELNRMQLGNPQRVKILEHFRQPVAYVTESLGKHFLGQSFPLTRKNQRIAELARELQWEMAIGYKIVLESALQAEDNKVDSRLLLTCLHRATLYLTATLLKSYQVYASPPPQVWLELHRLFLFAEHNELERTSVPDAQNTRHHNKSLSEVYKEALLHAIANPYRLSQNDITAVFKKLSDWAKYCQLLPYENLSQPSGLFVVNLESDEAPSYLANRVDLDPSLCRILSTEELTSVVRDHIVAPEHDAIDQLDANDTPGQDGLSQNTLRRLILAWGATPKRSFSRIEKNVNVDIALGLSASHYFIQKDKLDELQKSKSTAVRDGFLDPTFDSRVDYNHKAHFDTQPSHSQHSEYDVWDMAQNPSLAVDTQFENPSFSLAPDSQSTFANSAQEKDLYSTHTCLLTNESVGGCCLVWKNGTPTRTVVGSLVGIKQSSPKGNSPKWSIGVIRWLKHVDEETLVLGVEVLAPKARNVATQNISRKTRVGNVMRSLLLPELKTIDQPQTLLTTSLYQVGDKLEIQANGQQVKIRLTKLLESTSTFSQFQFVVLKAAPQKIQNGKLDRIKNFDAIWSSI